MHESLTRGKMGSTAKNTANLGDVKADRSFVGGCVRMAEHNHVYIDFGSADRETIKFLPSRVSTRY
jgi:hypothetical protein